MSSPVVRILHLTDIHFGAGHNFGAAGEGMLPAGYGSLLESITKDLDDNGGAPDMVVITGDVVSMGSREEFKEASRFLESLKNHWNLQPSQFLIVPGNHDVFWGRGDDVSRAEFDMFASQFYSRLPAELSFPSVQFGDVLIVGLDSTTLMKASLSGIGRIGRDQLSGLEDTLQGREDESRIRLLALHHHVLPVAWVEQTPTDQPASMTVDGQAVLAWAQERGFAGILHGHQHQSYVITFGFADKVGGPIMVAGGPSAGGQDLPPQGRNGFHLLEVMGSRIELSVREFLEDGSVGEVRRIQLTVEPTGVFADQAIPRARAARELSRHEYQAVLMLLAERVQGLCVDSYATEGGYRLAVRPGGAVHVRDGLQVVKSLRSADEVERRIVQVLAQFVGEVSDEVGDGRKTALMIWSGLVTEALEELGRGVDSRSLLTSMRQVMNRAVDRMHDLGTVVQTTEEVVRLATSAAGGDKDIGDVIGQAMDRIGKFGSIGTRVGGADDPLGVSLGIEELQFEVLVPDWIAQLGGGKPVILRSPAVLLSDAKISNIRRLLPVLEEAVAADRSVVLVAGGVDGDAAQLVAKNSLSGLLKAVWVRPTGLAKSGFFEDFAALTGATFVRSDSGDTIEGLTLAEMGDVQQIEVWDGGIRVTPSESGAARNRMREAIEGLTASLATMESEYSRSIVVERRARLSGGRAVICSRGSTAVESGIVAGLVADAVRSTSEGLRGGVVPGAGVALATVADWLESQPEWTDDAGSRAVAAALRIPSRAAKPLADVPIDAATMLTCAMSKAVDTAERCLRTTSIEVTGTLSDAQDSAE